MNIEESREEHSLELKIDSRDQVTDLELTANLQERALPASSPFKNWAEARKWCGPLPFTFSPEAATGRMVVVEGVRSDWDPRPVSVEVRRVGFFEQEQFHGTTPILANAFYTENIPYRWKSGTLK